MFTVSPGAHVSHPPGEGLEGDSASLIDSGVYSKDLSVFYYFRRAVMVDPFVSSVIVSVGDSGDGDLGVGSCLHDYWRRGIVGWIRMGPSGLCFVGIAGGWQ